MAGDSTPLMQQWHDVKTRHRDALVFFRVGDFYELFNQDAEEGARLLGLTLTSRNNGGAARVPLAGIPVKALDEYLARLVKAGRRVAICEQVEDPSQAKGIVRREVTETVTPGTVLNESLLPDRRNRWVVAVSPAERGVRGAAALDLSTGEFVVQRIEEAELVHELGRLEPAELVLARSEDTAEVWQQLAPPAAGGPPRTWRDAWLFDEPLARDELKRVFRVESLEGFGFGSDDTLLIRAAGAAVTYINEIRPSGIEHLQPPRIVRRGAEMALDEMTRRNLELVEPLRAGEQGGTLLSVIDEAVTAMGGRLLRRWILRPLVQLDAIAARLDAVEGMVEQPELREHVRSALRPVTDLERVAGRVGTGRVSPRDLLGLARSLAQLPAVGQAAGAARSALLRDAAARIDVLADVHALLERAISPEAPPSLAEGGVIRPGYSDELDELRHVRDGAVDFIAALQVRERERTGIPSLKVGFNKVFGYYLEVTRANLERVPDDYIRKQTLANAERYLTPELKEWEEKVFGAEDRIATLEADLFAKLRAEVAAQVPRLQQTAHQLAVIDVLSALAETAVRRGYVRPDVHSGFELEVRAGRHPVVETMMPREDFIPNDVRLDAKTGHIVVLTGPNMAGKSTVLRQVGLIQLLAQMGSFVPATEARLAVVDRIFTRVGASDNLARGQSTFMVEMNETAAILHGATRDSLVLLDEIGRGTSTYDGVSIAWAVTEHLHEHIGCKAIFATHYHELTQLADRFAGVTNLNVAVREVGDDIVFMRRLETGGADRSYGIQVARLAGVPRSVIDRARELLIELEGTHSQGGEGLGRKSARQPAAALGIDQLALFAPAPPADHPVLRRLRDLTLDQITPIEALNLLDELRRSLDNAGDD